MIFLGFIVLLFISCNTNKKYEAQSKASFKFEKVVYRGVINSDTVRVVANETENNWYSDLSVYVDSFLVYKDTSNNNFSIDDSSVKLLKIRGSKNSYILLTLIDVPSSDKWLVLLFSKNKILKEQILLKDFFSEVNNGESYLVGGRELSEAPCLDCDSAYYVPYQIYRLNKESIEYDAFYSRQMTTKMFGAYLGKEPLDTVLRLPVHTD